MHAAQPATFQGQAKERSYWIARGAEIRGPYPLPEIRRMAALGTLRPDDACSLDRQRWSPIGAILGGAGTRVDPAHVDPQHAAGSVLAALQDELIAEALARSGLAQPYLFIDPDIPPAAIGAARRAYAVSGDRLLCLYDATGGGAGDEGFAITTKGVHWRLSPDSSTLATAVALPTVAGLSIPPLPSLGGLSPVAGKATPLVGGMTFRSMPPQRPLVICENSGRSVRKIQFGAVNGMSLPRFDEQSLEALADFLAEAAAIAQRRSPRLFLREAELFAQRRDEAAAVDAFRRALQGDITLAGDVIAAVRRAPSHEPPGPIARFGLELDESSSDRERFWYLRRPDGVVEGPLPLNELRTMASEGRLFPDDEHLHFGDAAWRPIDSTWLAPNMAKCFRGCGRATAEQFQAALAALAAAQAPAEKLLLICATQPSAPGPVRLLAITGDELLIVTLPGAAAAGPPLVARQLWESAIWSLATQGRSQPARLTIAIAAGEFELLLLPGLGLQAVRETVTGLFLEKANASRERHEFFLAERFLNQISPGRQPEELARLRQQIGKQAEVIAVYDGGHPAIADRTLGALRFDSLGLEFASVVPGEATRLRLTYDQLREVLPPVRGALPDEMAKKVAQSERTAQLLKTGLAFSAAAVIPGGGLLVNGLMGKSKVETPPQNRLCIVAEIDGASYRLFFEVVADRPEDLNRQAKEFWAASNQVRGKFGGRSRQGGRESAEQVKLLREIRDLMHELVSLQRGTQGNANGAEKSEAGVRPDFAENKEGAIVGCPKCGQRMRVSSPGLAACPKCRQKVRIAAELFGR
jgi:hypothetical protein